MEQSPHGLFMHGYAESSDSMRKNGSPRAPRSLAPPTAEDWSKLRGLIHRLYIMEREPAKKLENVLRCRGFKVSERMIKQRLADWGYLKNTKKEDWGLLAVWYHQRQQSGKTSTIFHVHGQRKTPNDLRRYIRNQKSTPKEFLATHMSRLAQGHANKVPSSLRALTPEPEDIKVCSSTAASPTDSCFSPPPSPSTTSCAPDLTTSKQLLPSDTPLPPYSFEIKDQNRLQSIALPPSNAIESVCPTPASSHDSKVCRSHTPLISPKFMSCHHPEKMSETMSSHMLLSSDNGQTRMTNHDMRSWSLMTTPRPRSAGDQQSLDEEITCSMCHQPSRQHFTSLDGFEVVYDTQRSLLTGSESQHWHLPVSTKDQGAWVWVSRCFLACMCFSRGGPENEERGLWALKDGANRFEELMQQHDPLLLTAALLIITVLHTHDQDVIAARIMNSAKEVADRLRPPTDPIRATMAYYAASADETFHEKGIDSAYLESAYVKLKHTYPEHHPYVFTAHHNYGYMLRYEDKLVAAEKHLLEAYRASKNYFGERHMQTIGSLAVFAGCLRPQPSRRLECIETYRIVIKDASEHLSPMHPYVLRLKRELAVQLKNHFGPTMEVVELLKEVLWGRARMLGRSHCWTCEDARAEYEGVLLSTGKWHDADGKPSPEQLEIEKLFARDHDGGWVYVMGEGDALLMDSPDDVMTEDSGRKIFTKRITRTPSPTMANDYASY